MEMNFLLRILTLIINNLPVMPVSADWISDMIADGAEGMFYSFGDWLMGVGLSVLNWSLDIVSKGGDAMCGMFKNQSDGDAGVFNAINEATNTLVNTIQPIAAGIGSVISFACWLFAVIDLAIQDRLTPETFIKSTARLGVGLTLCANVGVLTKGMDDFGDAFCTSIQSAINSKDIEVTTFSSMECSNPQAWVGVVIYCVLLAGFILLAGIIVVCCGYIVQITRIFEIKIRAAFMGIPFGMLADDGWKGPGARYIKKYLALCCQGGVLIIIGNLTTVLLGACSKNIIDDLLKYGSGGGGGSLDVSAMLSSGGDALLSCITLVAVALAGVSIMFKSLGYVNDVFGA